MRWTAARLALALLVALLVALSSCSRDSGQVAGNESQISWSRSLEEAEAAAQKTGDPILASFEAYWCPWSRLLRDSVYADPAVCESLASYECAAIDADRDSSLCATYGIKIFPTVLVLDSYGNEVNRIIGFCSPGEFLTRLAAPGRSDRVLAEMFRREAQAPDDATFLLRFADLLRDMGTYEGAMLRYERAAEIDKGNRLGICEEATFAMAECCMLAGEYNEAGRRFQRFSESGFGSDLSGQAMMLGALCYEQAHDTTDAAALLQDYTRSYRRGSYYDLASKKIEALKASRDGR